MTNPDTQSTVEAVIDRCIHVLRGNLCAGYHQDARMQRDADIVALEKMKGGDRWSTIAARTFDPAKLMERAFEVVHHEEGCPSIGGRGDDDCECDAVPFLKDIAAALAAQPHDDVRELHPDTATLVDRFAHALKQKLLASQKKYGWSDNWMRPDWKEECQESLAQHMAKGDPRDVAAYAAFCWHHGWETALSTDSGPTEEHAASDGVERFVNVPRIGQKVTIADHFSDSEDWNKDDWYVVGLTTELGREGVNVWLGPEYPLKSEGPTDDFWIGRAGRYDDITWLDQPRLRTPDERDRALEEALGQVRMVKEANVPVGAASNGFAYACDVIERAIIRLKGATQ